MGKGVLLGTEVPDPRALGVTLGHVFIPGHVRGGGSIHVGERWTWRGSLPHPTSSAAWRALSPALCCLAGSAEPVTIPTAEPTSPRGALLAGETLEDRGYVLFNSDIGALTLEFLHDDW